MEQQLSQELITFRDLIANLVEIPAVHGHEEKMIIFMKEHFSDTADQVEIDIRGNVHAIFKGVGENKKL